MKKDLRKDGIEIVEELSSSHLRSAKHIGIHQMRKATKRAKLTFPDLLIKKPLIHEMTKNYDVVTNIEKADVRKTEGWVILEITGTGNEMNKAFQWLADQGVTVQIMLPDL